MPTMLHLALTKSLTNVLIIRLNFLNTPEFNFNNLHVNVML